MAKYIFINLENKKIKIKRRKEEKKKVIELISL